MDKIVTFLGFACRIAKHQYNNGRVALQLVGAVGQEYEGEPIATATVNVPEIQLRIDEVIVKDYSENKGILAVLEDAGIVKDTGEWVESGFVTMPICKLLI